VAGFGGMFGHRTGGLFHQTDGGHPADEVSELKSEQCVSA